MRYSSRDRGLSIIFHATHGGYTELVRYLLEIGADPNSQPEATQAPYLDCTAVSLDAAAGNHEMLGLLLDYGGNPTLNTLGLIIMPLAHAAEGGRYAAVETLVKTMDFENIVRNGRPDDNDRKMLLLVSAACGWEAVLQQLLERGCSPESVSVKGAFHSELSPGIIPMGADRREGPSQGLGFDTSPRSLEHD